MAKMQGKNGLDSPLCVKINLSGEMEDAPTIKPLDSKENDENSGDCAQMPLGGFAEKQTIGIQDDSRDEALKNVSAIECGIKIQNLTHVGDSGSDRFGLEQAYSPAAEEFHHQEKLVAIQQVEVEFVEDDLETKRSVAMAGEIRHEGVFTEQLAHAFDSRELFEGKQIEIETDQESSRNETENRVQSLWNQSCMAGIGEEHVAAQRDFEQLLESAKQSSWLEGKEEGREEGFAEGRLSGIAEGRQQGYQEGIIDGRAIENADRRERIMQETAALQKQLAAAEEAMQAQHQILLVREAAAQMFEKELERRVAMARDEEIRRVEAIFSEQVEMLRNEKIGVEEDVGRLQSALQKARSDLEQLGLDMWSQGRDSGLGAQVNESCAACASGKADDEIRIESARQEGWHEGREEGFEEGLAEGRLAAAAEARDEAMREGVRIGRTLGLAEAASEHAQQLDALRKQLAECEEGLRLCQGELAVRETEMRLLERDWERRALVTKEEEVRRVEEAHSIQMQTAAEARLSAEEEVCRLHDELERFRADHEQRCREMWTQGHAAGVQEGRAAAGVDSEDRLERARQDGWREGRAEGLEEGLSEGRLAAAAEVREEGMQEGIRIGRSMGLSEAAAEHAKQLDSIRMRLEEEAMHKCQSELAVRGAQIQLLERDWERRAVITREEEIQSIESKFETHMETVSSARTRAEEEVARLLAELELCRTDQEQRCRGMWVQGHEAGLQEGRTAAQADFAKMLERARQDGWREGHALGMEEGLSEGWLSGAAEAREEAMQEGIRVGRTLGLASAVLDNSDQVNILQNQDGAHEQGQPRESGEVAVDMIKDWETSAALVRKDGIKQTDVSHVLDIDNSKQEEITLLSNYLGKDCLNLEEWCAIRRQEAFLGGQHIVVLKTQLAASNYELQHCQRELAMLQTKIAAEWKQMAGSRQECILDGRSGGMDEAPVDPWLTGSTETRKTMWKVTRLVDSHENTSQKADLVESARTQFADSEEELQVCNGKLVTLGAQIESLERALSLREEEIRRIEVAHARQKAVLTQQLDITTEAKAHAEEEVERLLIELQQCRSMQEHLCSEMLTRGQQQGRDNAMQDCADQLGKAGKDGWCERQAVLLEEGLANGRLAEATEAGEEMMMEIIRQENSPQQAETKFQDEQKDKSARMQPTDPEKELQVCQSKLSMLGAQIEFMEKDWERRATVIREEESRRIEALHMQQIDSISEARVRAEKEISLLQGELERHRMNHEQLWRDTWTQGLQQGLEAARQDWEDRIEQARQDGWYEGRAVGLKEGLAEGQVATVTDIKGLGTMHGLQGDGLWLIQSSSKDEHPPAAAQVKLNQPEVELRLCQSKLVMLGAQIELMEKDWERRAAVIREEEIRRIEAAHALQADDAKEIRASAEEEVRLLQAKLECCSADHERRCLEMWSQDRQLRMDVQMQLATAMEDLLFCKQELSILGAQIESQESYCELKAEVMKQKIELNEARHVAQMEQMLKAKMQAAKESQRLQAELELDSAQQEQLELKRQATNDYKSPQRDLEAQPSVLNKTSPQNGYHPAAVQLVASIEELCLCKSDLEIMSTQMECMHADETRAALVREDKIRRHAAALHAHVIDPLAEARVHLAEESIRLQDELEQYFATEEQRVQVICAEERSARDALYQEACRLHDELERFRADHEQLCREMWTQGHAAGVQEGREAAGVDCEDRLERARQDGWREGRAEGLEEGLSEGRLAAAREEAMQEVIQVQIGRSMGLSEAELESERIVHGGVIRLTREEERLAAREILRPGIADYCSECNQQQLLQALQMAAEGARQLPSQQHYSCEELLADGAQVSVATGVDCCISDGQGCRDTSEDGPERNGDATKEQEGGNRWMNAQQQDGRAAMRRAAWEEALRLQGALERSRADMSELGREIWRHGHSWGRREGKLAALEEIAQQLPLQNPPWLSENMQANGSAGDGILAMATEARSCPSVVEMGDDCCPVHSLEQPLEGLGHGAALLHRPGPGPQRPALLPLSNCNDVAACPDSFSGAGLPPNSDSSIVLARSCAEGCCDGGIDDKDSPCNLEGPVLAGAQNLSATPLAAAAAARAASLRESIGEWLQRAHAAAQDSAPSCTAEAPPSCRRCCSEQGGCGCRDGVQLWMARACSVLAGRRTCHTLGAALHMWRWALVRRRRGRVGLLRCSRVLAGRCVSLWRGRAVDRACRALAVASAAAARRAARLLRAWAAWKVATASSPAVRSRGADSSEDEVDGESSCAGTNARCNSRCVGAGGGSGSPGTSGRSALARRREARGVVAAWATWERQVVLEQQFACLPPLRWVSGRALAAFRSWSAAAGAAANTVAV